MGKTVFIKKKNNRLLIEKDSGEELARINYDKGTWSLAFDSKKRIDVNGVEISGNKTLEKYDVLTIDGKKLYWANYFYEGNQQDLFRRDFLTLNGRISRSNYRALFFLILGLIPCVFFSPALIASYFSGRFDLMDFDQLLDWMESVIWVVFGGILLLFFIIITIKRMRDTGNPLWKIVVPFQNIKILLFEDSKRII